MPTHAGLAVDISAMAFVANGCKARSQYHCTDINFALDDDALPVAGVALQN